MALRPLLALRVYSGGKENVCFAWPHTTLGKHEQRGSGASDVSHDGGGGDGSSSSSQKQRHKTTNARHHLHLLASKHMQQLTLHLASTEPAVISPTLRYAQNTEQPSLKADDACAACSGSRST